MQSRRKFLLMGTAVGTLAAIGGAGATLISVDRYQGWVHAVLRRSLPGYKIQAEGLERFVEDYNATEHGGIKLRAFAATQHFFDATFILPAGMKSNVDDGERTILTSFLLGSDFFEHYPNGSKIITYRGAPEACGSPFATF
jgi:hypothetical protein